MPGVSHDSIAVTAAAERARKILRNLPVGFAIHRVTAVPRSAQARCLCYGAISGPFGKRPNVDVLEVDASRALSMQIQAELSERGC